MSKKKKVCLTSLMRKIESIDSKICEMRAGLTKIKATIEEEADEQEEICPDEIESQKALIEAIQEICLEGLLEREPEGDA